MTHPLGRVWRQPDAARIAIDDTHALMDSATFDALAEYSCSEPTGVYPGKMWRRHDGLYDRRCKPENRRWLLCWFDESERGPEWCSTRFREILIA